MSRSNRLRILCYDISCKKWRRKIARLLEDKASRVQYSVFETRLSDGALARLVDSLEPFLEGLRVYTIGQTGERHCEVHGAGIPVETETGYWLM
ncbi:CRISPR-associated endonuclease Cas2 [Thalassospira alkalitolerans]|uniref:CRISPR-associated endonuclease Cas2 n=1 Tax=Thalassospira alkalitolerans TaxID=1293890 RepID=UPI003AA80099